MLRKFMALFPIEPQLVFQLKRDCKNEGKDKPRFLQENSRKNLPLASEGLKSATMHQTHPLREHKTGHFAPLAGCLRGVVSSKPRF